MKYAITIPLDDQLILDSMNGKPHAADLVFLSEHAGTGSLAHLLCLFMDVVLKQNTLVFHKEELLLIGAECIDTYRSFRHFPISPNDIVSYLIDSGYFVKIEQV